MRASIGLGYYSTVGYCELCSIENKINLYTNPNIQSIPALNIQMISLYTKTLCKLITATFFFYVL